MREICQKSIVLRLNSLHYDYSKGGLPIISMILPASTIYFPQEMKLFNLPDLKYNLQYYWQSYILTDYVSPMELPYYSKNSDSIYVGGTSNIILNNYSIATSNFWQNNNYLSDIYITVIARFYL